MIHILHGKRERGREGGGDRGRERETKEKEREGGSIECNSLATYCSDMYLSVGEHEKALEIMAENGWIDRSVIETQVIHTSPV